MRRLLPFLIGMPLGIAWYLAGFGFPSIPWRWLVWVPVMWLLVVAVHEGGHLLGARLAGFRFLFMTIGPLRIALEGGRLRWSFYTGLNNTGGLTCCVPTGEEGFRRRMILMVACGPLASLAGGLLVYAWAPPFRAWQVFAVLSLSAFAVSALPVHRDVFYFDGALISLFLRNGEEAEQLSALLLLYGAACVQRPREWSAALLKKAAQGKGRSAAAYSAALLGYGHALDAGDLEQAGKYLEEAQAHGQDLPPQMRSLGLVEAAYFAASHRGDAAGARALLEQAGPGFMEEDHERLRAEAAILLAEGRFDGALEKAEAGLQAARRSRFPGAARADLDWLEDLARRAREAGVAA
jgi:hypothetical protein